MAYEEMMLEPATAESESEAAPHERRASTRHATVLQVAKLVTPRGEELCILRDISATGLRASIYCALAAGERVAVELKTGRRFGGRVAWVADGAMGLEFDARVPVLAILAHRTLDQVGRRIRLPRIAVDLPARLRIGGAEFPVRLRDMSQGGLACRVDRALRPGTMCEVLIDALGLRRAHIRWCRDGVAGLGLRQPLTYPEFAAWRQALAGQALGDETMQ